MAVLDSILAAARKTGACLAGINRRESGRALRSPTAINTAGSRGLTWRGSQLKHVGVGQGARRMSLLGLSYCSRNDTRLEESL